jgi:hypothetical protein
MSHERNRQGIERDGRHGRPVSAQQKRDQKLGRLAFIGLSRRGAAKAPGAHGKTRGRCSRAPPTLPEAAPVLASRPSAHAAAGQPEG